jgi:O-antigen ligase
MLDTLNTQSFGRLVQKLEPGIVVLLFIILWDFNLPPFLPGATYSLIKAGSYVVVFFLAVRRWKQILYIATRDITLCLLVVLAMASFLWSANPASTSIEVRALVRTCILGAYLAAYYTPREQMQLLAWVFGISGLLSVVAALALPAYGIGFVNGVNTWQGILLHKQYLARSMTMGAVLFLLNVFDSKRSRWIALIGFSLAIGLILLSTSKSALVFILLSLSLLPLSWFIKQNYKLQVVLYLVSLLVAGSVAIILITNLETIVVDQLGKDMDFNGRVPIWNLCLDKIWERPLLGYGYAGFWTSEESLYVINNSWASGEARNSRFHAHNGFIEVLLSLGWLGGSLFIINFITVLTRVVTINSSTKTKESFWYLQFLTISIFYNLTEVGTIVSNHLIWALYVSIALSTALQQERIKRRRYLDVALNST